MLCLSASEPLRGVCSSAVSADSFVPTHSSKASKDCPVGFAEFGSVSVVRPLFSVGSNIFVCMSCWSRSFTGSEVPSCVSGPRLPQRSQESCVYWLLTNKWNTWVFFDILVSSMNVCVSDSGSPDILSHRVECFVLAWPSSSCSFFYACDRKWGFINVS